MAREKIPARFHTVDYWERAILKAGGRIHGVSYPWAYTMEADFVDGGWWFSKIRGKNQRAEAKKNRDRIAREMRKDGWNVKVHTEESGLFINAERYKKDKTFYLRRA